MASFAFILSSSPYVGEKLDTLYNLASAALKKEHKVFVYLNFDGIYTPLKNQKAPLFEKNPGQIIGDLIQNGAKIICSSIDTRIRGIDNSKQFIDGIKTGSLSDVAEELATADRLITL